MPSCHDCIYHNPRHNLCLVYALPPRNARTYPHLCGPDAKEFRQIVWVPRQIPKKDEMYKPDTGQKNDF